MPVVEKSSLLKLTSDDIFTSREVADLLHVTLCTLSRYRQEGTGPLYIEVNHKVKLYPKLALYQWMAKRVRKSTSDRGVRVEQISETLEEATSFLLPPSPVAESSQRKRGRPRTLPPISSFQQPASE